MRRIWSSEEEEGRKKRNQIIISIFILGMLVLSSLGYAFISQDSESSSGSGDKNQQQLPDGRWQVMIDNQPFIFTHPSSKAESISVSGVPALQYFAASPAVYIASNSTAVNYEIGSTLGRYINLQPACFGPCPEDLPEKNCTNNEILIVWNSSDENRVFTQDNCILIEGDLRAVDSFLYKVFSIT